MKKEIWKWIGGQKGKYQVSNLGRVRSVDRWIVYKNGRKRFYKGVLLSPVLDQDGYQLVSICGWPGRKVKLCKVHRLVLEAFVGPCPVGCETAHDDGNPQNNRLSNLFWKTVKSNHDDKRRHGTDNVGERNGRSLVTEKQVIAIREAYAEGGLTYHDLASFFGVGLHVISNIIKYKTWRHVHGNSE